MHLVQYMKRSASESKPFQNRSKVKIPGWASWQDEQLSSSKLKQLFPLLPCPYWGSSARHSHRSVTGENLCIKTLSSWSQSFKCQLHTTHVGAVGWELHSSSPTTCAGKADHGFGVRVPLALICLLKIVN